MAQKKKTIADYQEAFKQLFREMESELGSKASDVRVYTKEVYPDRSDNAFVSVAEPKKQRVAVCNISFGDDEKYFLF